MRKWGTVKLVVALSIGLLPGTFFSETHAVHAASNSQKQQVTLVKQKNPSTNLSSSVTQQTYDLSKINHREIIVEFKKGVTQPFKLVGAKLVLQNGKSLLNGIEILQVEKNQDYATLIHRIQQSSKVRSASPNYIQHISYMPTDALIKEQWYLKSLNMFKAWDVTKGTENPVTVAVLDTGVNANQPDLAGKVLQGYNFLDDNTNTTDNNGHGTAVAGLIAASATSGSVVGVDFNAKILPIKVADAKGDLQDSLIIQGINYAINHGAKVINMSFGGTNYDKAMNEALQKAHDAGVVLVAASGNSGLATWEFPASDDNVISVAATDEYQAQAPFSNYGNFIDLGAPGMNMLVLKNPNGYTSENGTSFATPLVSGAAALLKSLHPDWSPDIIEWALESSTSGSTTDHSWDPSLGYGPVDVYAALKTSLPTGVSTIPSSYQKALILKNGVPMKRTFELPNEKDWYSFNVPSPTKVTIQINGGASYYDLVGELYQNSKGQLTRLTTIDNGSMGQGETYSFTAQPGTYDLSVYDYFGHWSNTIYSVDVTTQEVPAPKASIKAGTYDHPLSVTLDAPKGATINYTLDGSAPSSKNGQTYKQPIVINKTTTLKAMTLTSSGWSSVATYTYTLNLPAFPDIKGNWAENEISYLASKGWVHGYSNGKFGPSNLISRAEAAEIIATQLKLPNAKPDFKDVPTTQFAYGAIGAVEKAQIMKGHQNGNFDPNGSITRGQMAALLVNAYKLKGDAALSFQDVQKGDWDAGFIQALVANHIANGYKDGTFKPKKSITRSEFSVMLAKVLNPSFR